MNDIIAAFVVGLALGMAVIYAGFLTFRKRIGTLRYAAGFEAGKQTFAAPLARAHLELDAARTECFVLEQAAAQHRELLEAVSNDADQRIAEAQRRANPLTQQDLADLKNISDMLKLAAGTFASMGSLQTTKAKAGYMASLSIRERLENALAESNPETDESKVAA